MIMKGVKVRGLNQVKFLWIREREVMEKRPVCGFSSVQSLSHVWLFTTPWTAACQASLSITNSWSLLKLISIELVMPSNHLILCCPLLLPPSIFLSTRVFSNESALCIREQKLVAKILKLQLQHLKKLWIYTKIPDNLMDLQVGYFLIPIKK